MDLQIRNEKMVELDKKYGGVIYLGRNFLFEVDDGVRGLDGGRLRIYGFSDMVLVGRIGEDGANGDGDGWRRIYLDGQSFVEAPMDGKYLINKLFLCGTKDSLHCRFNNSAARDKVY